MLERLKYSVPTLPDTNTREWARLAREHLRREGVPSEVCLVGDLWTLELQERYGRTEFMNVPLVVVS